MLFFSKFILNITCCASIVSCSVTSELYHGVWGSVLRFSGRPRTPFHATSVNGCAVACIERLEECLAFNFCRVDVTSGLCEILHKSVILEAHPVVASAECAYFGRYQNHLGD